MHHDCKSALAPVVIGVTGHRDIDMRDARLANILRGELEGLGARYRRRSFIIVSPLAEGADRLVARLAIEVLGAQLVVPLPLPVDGAGGYKMDFPDSIAEFDDLLARADEVFEGPMRSKGDAWQSYTPQRNRQYAWVGAYIVEHVQVLIALWDGKPARGVGGTAHVVTWFLSGRVAKVHSTLKLKPRGSLPPARPELLIHINPTSCDVVSKELAPAAR